MSEGSALWPQGFLLVVAGVFGLVVGSFLNVVIHRLPRDESLVHPGSHCPRCGRAVRPWENVPVLSYLLLRGRCAGCRGSISWRYPAVELATALLFVGVAWRHGPGVQLTLWCAFAAALFTAAVIDFELRIVRAAQTLGGLGEGLLAVPLVSWLDGLPWWPVLAESLLGAVTGGGSLWIIGFLHARLSATLGRRFEHWPEDDYPRPTEADYWLWFPGMGLGDVKLLAMIGVFLGPAGVLETLCIASLAGLVLGMVLATLARSFSQPFGFGPALALGAICVLMSPVRLAAWLMP